MARKNIWAAGFVVIVTLCLPLTACKDTKTLQENEQLKVQVAELQKTNDQLGSNLETVTAARDELAKENEALKAQLKPKKSKHTKKTAHKKHHTS